MCAYCQGVEPVRLAELDQSYAYAVDALQPLLAMAEAMLTAGELPAHAALMILGAFRKTLEGVPAAMERMMGTASVFIVELARYTMRRPT